MGHTYCMLKNKTRKHKVHLSIPGKTDKVHKHSKILPDFIILELISLNGWGWSGDAMVLGKLPVLGRPLIGK